MSGGVPGPRARGWVRRTAVTAGIDPGRALRSLRGLPQYVRDERRYRRLRERGTPDLSLGARYPILADRYEQSGVATGHYFHQDLWAARKLFERRPDRHFDIGSRVDGFVSSAIVFVPVTVIDIRPLQSTVPNLEFVQADATDLAFLSDGSVASISSLHAVEHFGLGRYGDPVDPGAWRRAIAELVRVAASDGRVYFSVPIGRERVEFNAHRVFDPRTIIEAFSALELIDFAAVDDAGDLVSDADPADFTACDYSCGLFEFGRS